MNPTLDISGVVSASVTIAPTAIPYTDFGALVIAGTSDVIDTTQRIRKYASLIEVAADFPQNSPEYKAAVPYFSQLPQPNLLFIGRFAQTATRGLLHGAVLTILQQGLTAFNAITTGSFKITIDGVEKSVTAINLSSATNLNGIAALVQDKLDDQFAGATCVWDAAQQRFDIKSGTTGTGSTVGYASAAPSGADLSTLLGLTSAAAGPSASVGGIGAETPLSAVLALENSSSQWYGLTFAAASPISDDDHIIVASHILASARARLYGITIKSTAALDPTQTSDLASRLHALGNRRVFWQYSSKNDYAVTSFFGRAFTVNFNAQNSTITLMFKQEPGIEAEALTETQAQTIKDKGGNVFVKYSNGASIIQHGQMANGFFFDEVHGLDWLVNAIQTDVFNRFYQTKSKIPQTDSGINTIINTIEATLARAVFNGLVAPGVWNADGFGQLKTGDVLSNGFYVFCIPMALQSQADRETRVTPPIMIAVKLAGAIHDVIIAIDVNR